VREPPLSGTLAAGPGSAPKVPQRTALDPCPWHSFAVWIMTQMKRWGQLKGSVDYAKVAQEVFLATDAARLMKEVGLNPPAQTSKRFSVMKKEFDPSQPEAYLASFPIKRTA
jgi:nitrate/nitrite transport system substrate-binding protein